jgi:hypothetical protein
MLTALKPVGGLEEILVDRVVACAWNFRRVIQVESALFASARYAWSTGPCAKPGSRATHGTSFLTP